jgi:hypothetical protein
MTVQSLSGRTTFDRVAGARAAATLHVLPRMAAPAQAGEAAASTRLSLSGGAAGSGLAYGMPRIRSLEPTRLWAAGHEDPLSALMLSNSGPDDVKLADHWRGLGGTLLRQLAATGRGSTQTLAEVPPPPEDDAAAVEDAAAPAPVVDAAELQAKALAGVTTGAVKVSLKIATRSGQSIDLEIAVNDGKHGGTRGLKVQIDSSDALSDGEREALAALADGLDQALEGLGQRVPQLDLTRLSEFDGGGELAALDIAVDDPNAVGPGQAGALHAFSLHLDKDRKALSLKRVGSEMALSVAGATANTVEGDQRRAAIDRTLVQIDAAAERGHADPLTVRLFKDAFRQLQAPPRDARPQAPAEGDPPSEAQSLQSGLADFEASFRGSSHKPNRFGGLTELGSIDYQIGQKTSSTRQTATGGLSLKQVQTEASDASIQKMRTVEPDPALSNYDETDIHDRKTVTTIIDCTRTAVVRALRKTEENRLTAYSSIERNHLTAHREVPLGRSLIERLA